MEAKQITIPTWSPEQNWHYTHFETKDELKEFMRSLFKEPGLYNFDTVSKLFNEHARVFLEYEKKLGKGIYNEFRKGSKQYVQFWDAEKEKCRKGVIFKNDKGDVWYLPRFFYHWLNFLQIYDKRKEVKRFVFPEFRDVQYHMCLYEYLAELHDLNGVTIKRRQVASEQPHSEPVLGEYGWTIMGEISIGDKLQNPDGTLTTILHKSDNGLSDVYEFEFMDKRKVRCGIEHNWELVDRGNEDKIVVLNTKQLLEKGLFCTPVKGKLKVYNNYRFSINPIKPVDFGIENKFVIPPYLLGAFLGDGSVNQSMYICGIDPEIQDRIQQELGEDYELTNNTISREKLGYSKKFVKAVVKYKGRFSKDNFDKFHNGKYGANPILRELDRLGLRILDNAISEGKKGMKFIPDEYKQSSIEDRIALIQGMMDTDGYVNAVGRDIHFTNINKRLVDDFVEVVRSLGIRITVDVKQPDKNSKFNCKVFYRARICGNIKFDIFNLSRKKDRMLNRNNEGGYDKVPLIGITKLDYQEESSCIIVDNPNRLYITKDFIPTHNSYIHTAKIYNRYIFEEGYVAKIFASDKSYIEGQKGCWRYLDHYRDFTNSKTAWIRHNAPNKTGDWQQRIITTITNTDGKKIDHPTGTKAVIVGITLEKDAAKGVGGAVDDAFYEEAGIADEMDISYGYLREAMRESGEVTGYFSAAGSVGDLKQCKPLEKFVRNPRAYDFYPVVTTLMDDTGQRTESGLFIPIFWGYSPYIDEAGNSLVEEAKAYINKMYEEEKKKKGYAAYQLLISQGPRTISEAFAIRSESVFPIKYTGAQIKRIEDNEYYTINVDLERNETTDKIIWKRSDRLPMEFPIDSKIVDKRGCGVMHEKPIENAPWLTYLIAIDPVEKGQSESSDSLAAIYVWKMPVEITKTIDGVQTIQLEGGKLVFEWVGRYDDIDDTNEMLSMVVEFYNGWTMCENNKSTWIQYMRSKKRQKYMARKTDMIFDKEVDDKQTFTQEYGIFMTAQLWENNLLPYTIDFLSAKLAPVLREEGDKREEKIMYGVERIGPFIRLLREMQSYNIKDNFDSVKAFAILVGFIRALEAKGVKTIQRIERTDKENEEMKQKYLSLKTRDMFHNIGRQAPINTSIKRSAFRNIK